VKDNNDEAQARKMTKKKNYYKSSPYLVSCVLYYQSSGSM